MDNTPQSRPTTRWPSERRRVFVDSVLAGLLTNAITAAFIVVVAVIGGRWQFLKGVAFIIIAIASLGLSGLFTYFAADPHIRTRSGLSGRVGFMLFIDAGVVLWLCRLWVSWFKW